MPDSVVTHIVAVVGGKDDDCVFFQPEIFQFLQYPAQIAIDAAYRGEILAHHAFDSFGVEIRIVRVGDRRFLVGHIGVGRGILLADRQPAGVRCPGVPATEKWFFAFLFQKADHLVREDVRRQPGKAFVPAAFLHHWIDRGPAAVSMPDEQTETMLARVVKIRLTEMPFADQSGVISRLL